MKNLIIKGSYSKLPGGGIKSNFGDLIRSTVLLNCIGDDFLWLTDLRANNLLKHFIPSEKIIILKNLDNIIEKNYEIYNLDNYLTDKEILGKIKGRWHGYIFDGKKVSPANELIRHIEPYCNSDNKISWQQALVEGLGFKWEKQDYALPADSKIPSTDIGLNYHVHHEWKSKVWPSKNWKKLKKLLEKDYSVSLQQGLNNFDEYIDWISSCKLIVTCDSLGLHLASALRKKVIAIVGPTKNGEFHYNRTLFITPQYRRCMPCNSKDCMKGKSCLEDIASKEVEKRVRGYIK
jgi:heptosyltransferase-2